MLLFVVTNIRVAKQFIIAFKKVTFVTGKVLDEDNNKKKVRNIENENNEPPTKHRKLNKNTQLQMESWVLTTSEPSFNQESTKSVVHKIKTEKTESKTALKTENKNLQKKMISKPAHKKIHQVK